METINPTQAPEAQFKYIERNLDVPLNDGEIYEASKKLAAAAQEKSAVEREKSEASRGFARRIRNLNKVIEQYSSQIADGFEERVVKCKVQFNYPSGGEKTVTRCDNDVVIAVLSMDQDELREVLPFDQTSGEDDTDIDGEDDEHDDDPSGLTGKTTEDESGHVRLTQEDATRL